MSNGAGGAGGSSTAIVDHSELNTAGQITIGGQGGNAGNTYAASANGGVGGTAYAPTGAGGGSGGRIILEDSDGVISGTWKVVKCSLMFRLLFFHS